MSVREVTPELDRNLDRIAAKLRSNPRISILTGAGLSAASGIPTFRGQAAAILDQIEQRLINRL